MTITTILIIFFVAAGITTIASTIGIGGGLLLVPSLILLAHLDPASAAGTSLAAIVVSSFTASFRNFRMKTIHYSLAACLAAGSVSGAIIGARIADVLPELQWKFLFVIIALYLLMTMIRVKEKNNLLQYYFSVMNRLPIKKIHFNENQGVSVVGLILTGIFIGILSAILGLGGGFIATPLLLVGMKLPHRIAVSTSVAMIFLTALSGSISHFLLGHLNVSVWMAAVAGTFVGGLMGSKILHQIPEKLVRYMFAIVLLVAIILLMIKQ
ncbi:MAG: sulfite exporter TauE/SafE family protein [Calditrichia bacterium]